MRFCKTAIFLILLLSLSLSCFAAKAQKGTPTKKFDLTKYHDVGNIWLRVSNYGFFGSGDDADPQYPSLEYPGGSGIDYLYQGALWFGAKKIRRDLAGNRLFWVSKTENTTISEADSLFNPVLYDEVVIDTLTSVGFDGDADLYEFLPAYNLTEQSTEGIDYTRYTAQDTILEASIRTNRRGVDDDGDGRVDEDPPGYGFKFRDHGLPDEFAAFAGQYLENMDPAIVDDYIDKWFPLGFVDLSENDPDTTFCFSAPNNDDGDFGDLLVDEDGYPVSEQDYISYYYDYSPFDPSKGNDYGGYKDRSDHYPLNIRVRQMSYQWSYEYIKNLIYVEFDITNMNPYDTLFDCAMGIYMDSDVGPQSWEADDRSMDDVSSYVPGDGYEFAYTYDYDKDSGLTQGMVGARVCTPDPDPDSLNFSCWYWNRGDGPNDEKPLDFKPTGRETANEKYYLLTGRNPDDDKYVSLRDFPEHQKEDPDDTRYLFGFYGDMNGMNNPTSKTWNLPPGETMKIVIAVFPGDSEEELKQTAVWAKEIYRQPQRLQDVILPDIYPHYNPPEPPEIPRLFAEVIGDGDRIDVYWDNRPEFTLDFMTVSKELYGYQNTTPELEDSYDPNIQPTDENYNANAIVSPQTANRLQHDFQGYSLWGRSGSGSREHWMLYDNWDKIDSWRDLLDYDIVKFNPAADYTDFGGELGEDKGLPQPKIATAEDTCFYKLSELYELEKVEIGDTLYGLPIFNPDLPSQTELENMAANWNDPNINPHYNPLYGETANGMLLFKHPDMPANVYLSGYGVAGNDDDKELIQQSLCDGSLITLPGYLGEANIGNPEKVKERLARRYYTSSIPSPNRGIEYYVSVTARDRGMPSKDLLGLESGKDANMRVFFPGTVARNNMDDIHVVPNPYIGLSSFDGRRENDDKGDRSKRIWFVGLPEECTIRIYTLAGDLVDEIEHNGEYVEDIISVSKEGNKGIAASGMHSWDMLSKYDQIIASGVYLFSVENHEDDEIKVGKFVLIK